MHFQPRRLSPDNNNVTLGLSNEIQMPNFALPPLFPKYFLSPDFLVKTYFYMLEQEGMAANVNICSSYGLILNSFVRDVVYRTIIYPTKTKEGFGSFFTVENEITNDKHRIAKGFCRFFSTVAETLKTKAFPLTNCCWTRPSKPNTEPQCKFIFKSVSVDEVRLYLSKLQRIYPQDT